jgi:hypothetical protein
MNKNILKIIFWEYFFPFTLVFALIYIVFFNLEINNIIKAMIFFISIFLLIVFQVSVLRLINRREEGFRG